MSSPARPSGISLLTILTNVEPLNTFTQNQIRERTGAGPGRFSHPALAQTIYPALKHDKEFRVLHLAPESAGSLLDCTLSVASLAEEPIYESLSYVWGPSTQARKMLCNGVEINVTDNLYAALGRMRKATQIRTLWVDAICINQADVIEKNHQVHMMSSIYRNAQKVLIWLGEERDDTTQAWSFFDDLETSFNNGFNNYDSDLNDISKWLGPGLNPLGKGLPARESPVWGAMEALLRSPWFSRIWTFQEIIVAANAVVYCGSHMMPWERFIKLIKWIHVCGHSKSVNYLDNEALTAGEAQMLYHNKNASRSRLRSLSYALLRTRNRDATDSRDKIYALFGLLSEGSGLLGQELYPDYTLSSRDAYIAFAKWCLIMEQDLMILSAARPRREGIDLPSWVPDWECKDFHALLVGQRSDGFRSFQASGTSRPFSNSGPADSINTLHLRGGILCTIAEISDPTDILSNLDDRKWIPTASHYADMAKQLGLPEQYLGQPAGLAYGRTLGAGLTMGFCERDDGRLCAGARENVWRANLTWKKQGHPQPPPLEVLHEIGLHTNKMIRGRKFFTSGEHGLIGLCPDTARVGDVVCILLGGEVPYVLRTFGGEPVKQADVNLIIKSRHFELVGEAYVHGIMDGESVSKIDPFDFILH